MQKNKIKKKELEKGIRNSGFRLTGTRKTIINVLSNAKKPLSAEEIFIQSRKKNLKIGIATVYRTLSMLEDFNIVTKKNIENNRVKYGMNYNRVLGENRFIESKNKNNLNKKNIKKNVEKINPDLFDLTDLENVQDKLNRWIIELKKIRNEKEIKLEEIIKDFGKVDKILKLHDKNDSNLIQILLDVQNEYRWLPKHALLYLGNKLDVPLSRIYSIASFYKFFELKPKGKYQVIVCTGTACHVRGASNLLQRIVNILKIKPGDTTADYRFTLDTVNCLGCCALGPVMYFNDKYYSNPSTKELNKMFSTV